MFLKFKEVYQYRQMLKSLIMTDLRTRYKGSFLGFLWTFVNPLLSLAVYTVVFSTIMRIDLENYSIYLFVGILPWIYFSTSVQNGAGVVIRQNGLVKKVYFPRILLPLSTVGAALMNYLFSLLIMIPAVYYFGYDLQTSVAYFPLVLLIQTIFTLGLTIFVACLNVYFRDLEHIIGILMMAWFYFTPIVYPAKMVPEQYLNFFSLNPLMTIVESYQQIFYYRLAPDMNALTVVGALGLVILAISLIVYEKLQRGFAEEL